MREHTPKRNRINVIIATNASPRLAIRQSMREHTTMRTYISVNIATDISQRQVIRRHMTTYNLDSLLIVSSIVSFLCNIAVYQVGFPWRNPNKVITPKGNCLTVDMKTNSNVIQGPSKMIRL